MLTVNQNILVDFASKEAVHVTDFKYKQGEIDKSGINIDIASASITENTVLKVNWLYAADYDYVYVQNDGDYISSTKMKIYPPQNTLLPGLVAFEILLVEMSGETPLSQLKGPSVYIPVAEALIDDEEASMEDENIAAIISLINENDRLIGVVEQLDADVRAAEAVRDQNETNRNSTLDAKVSTVNLTVATANTAKTNADNAATSANTKATLANDKATLANTARDAANAAKTAADTAKSAADTATINANNAATAANNAATAANTAATSANTAATNANNAATAANTAADRATAAISSSNAAVTEISQARIDMSGTTHASIGARMNSDFNTLASAVPKEIAVSGTETVVSNDTLSGEVSSAVLSGNTMVNVGGNVSSNDITYPSGSGSVFSEQNLSHTLKKNETYTVVYTIKKGTTTSVRCTPMIKTRSNENAIYHSTSENFNATAGVKVWKLTTGNTFDYVKFGFWCHTPTSEVILAKEFIILEGDHTDKPLSFFEGLKSAEVAEIGTHGVNLIPSLEANSINEIGKDYDIANYTRTGYCPVKEGVTYIFSKNLVTRNVQKIYYDKNKKFIMAEKVDTVNIFTTPPTATFVRLTWGDTYDSSIKYMLTEGSKLPKTYIPYQESKTTLSESITLRSLPNGVADTYDVDTGVLTRRCGEVVLNGSESWHWINNDQTDSLIWFSGGSLSNIALAKPLGIISDKFDGKNGWENSKEGIYTTSDVAKPVLIYIAKSKLATPDVAGFKSWLAQNPTTVVYQLATPTTEYIENNGQLRSYDSQTTISVESVVPCDIKSNIPINLKAWLESQNVTMAMLANDASIQAAMMEQIEEEQKVQSAEISSAQLALIDLYEMGL